MAKVLKTIKVIPGGEVDRLLEEAGEAAVELERDGVFYRLARTSQPRRWAGDAGLAPVTMTLEETAGSVPPLDPPRDWQEVERIAKEERVERSVRKMQDR